MVVDLLDSCGFYVFDEQQLKNADEYTRERHSLQHVAGNLFHIIFCVGSILLLFLSKAMPTSADNLISKE